MSNMQSSLNCRYRDVKDFGSIVNTDEYKQCNEKIMKARDSACKSIVNKCISNSILGYIEVEQALEKKVKNLETQNRKKAGKSELTDLDMSKLCHYRGLLEMSRGSMASLFSV